MTRAATLALAAIAAATLGGCNQREVIPVANVERVTGILDTQVDGIVTAYTARDAAKAASFDAPDYRGIYPGAPDVVGPEADRAEMAGQFKDPANRLELNGEPRITVSAGGSMALYERGYAYTRTDSASGKVISDKGTWFAMFRQQPDGTMKLWRSILVPGPAASPPAKN